MSLPDYLNKPHLGGSDYVEDRVVKKILKAARCPEGLRTIRQRVAEFTGKEELRLAYLNEVLNGFPLRLVASNKPNVTGWAVADLSSAAKFKKSPLYRCYRDAMDEFGTDDMAMGLVFPWARIGDCVLHQLADLDTVPGFQITWRLSDNSRLFRLDPLTQVLASLFGQSEEPEGELEPRNDYED